MKTPIAIIVGLLFIICTGYAIQHFQQPEEYTQPTVLEQQIFLNSLNSSRYNCGIEDGIAGRKFNKALNNWCNDQIAQEYFK